ncbi:hypothetical protein Q7P37_002948 [Cladosporium fusiforme]
MIKSTRATAVDKSNICHWSKLPAELRFEIMLFAYAREDFGGFILPPFWEYREESKRKAARLRRQPYTPAVFHHYVNQFMITKQWLPEAARGFFSTLHCICTGKQSVFNIGTAFYRNDPFLGLQFLKRLEMDNMGLVHCAPQLAKDCPHLRHLHVHIDHLELEKMFDERDDLCVWYEPWTVELLQNSLWFRSVSALSGLKHAALSLGRVRYRYYSYEEVATFHANHRLMALVFIRSATRPRSTPAPASRLLPFFGPAPALSYDVLMAEFDRSVTKEDFLTLMKYFPDEAATWMVKSRAKLLKRSNFASRES